MNPQGLLTAYYTIVRKDARRIFRIWPQTFLPSAITSALYFLIFGAFLGSRIGDIGTVPYVSFVVPGLVMLAVVTNSFANVATVMFSAKFMVRNIDEILVSPTPPWVVVAGFITSGVVRGTLVGILVLIVSAFFARISVYSVPIVVGFLILTSLAFSLGGLVNGIFAKTFDGISIIPTFVLAPLVYLGGVFYSVDLLPDFWKALSHLNPIFYIINGFRYGFLGFADVSLGACFAVLGAIIVMLGAISLYQLRTGLGLKQ
jgi:ABC-2 type transport system permease protein